MPITVPLKLMSAEMLTFELTAQLHRFDAIGRDKITSAMTVAAFAHEGQLRRARNGISRVPYIEHPLRVALRLIRWGCRDAAVITAALLHDVVEDAPARIAGFATDSDKLRSLEAAAAGATDETALTMRTAHTVLSRHYGKAVGNTVMAVTNVPWSDCNYEQKVSRIINQESTAPLLIKLSDTCDNAGSLLHQRGHVDDSFIVPKLKKYMPTLGLMIAASRHRAAGESQAAAVLTTAADHAEGMVAKLVILANDMNVRLADH